MCRGCHQQRSATQVTQPPLQPRFGARQLLAFFPKTKITFEREEISDCRWDLGKYDKAADGDSNKGFCRVFWTVEETLGELCEVPKCLLGRGLRCHCPIYNVSYIVFNKCLFSIVHGWILSGQTSYIKALSCTYALFNLNMPLLRMYYN